MMPVGCGHRRGMRETPHIAGVKGREFMNLTMRATTSARSCRRMGSQRAATAVALMAAPVMLGTQKQQQCASHIAMARNTVA